MAGNFIPMVYAVLRDKGVDTKGMSTDEAVKKYEELTGKTGRYSTASGEKAVAEKVSDDSSVNKTDYVAEKSRKNFINIQLCAAKLSEQSVKELRKSERSFLKRIQQHKEKIENPAKHAENWEKLDEIARQGLVAYWQKEIVEFEKKLEEVRMRLNEK